ncbi:MAG TPA: hypothetical protein VIJ18_08820 [Microbacteriaceae bacterium]
MSQSGDQDADGSLLLTSDEVLWALDLVGVRDDPFVRGILPTVRPEARADLRLSVRQTLKARLDGAKEPDPDLLESAIIDYVAPVREATAAIQIRGGTAGPVSVTAFVALEMAVIFAFRLDGLVVVERISPTHVVEHVVSAMLTQPDWSDLLALVHLRSGEPTVITVSQESLAGDRMELAARLRYSITDELEAAAAVSPS